VSKSDRFSKPGMRIILFGSEGGFSRPVLEQLLIHGLNVTAVVMIESPHENSNFPASILQAAKPGGLEALANKNEVAVLKTQALNDGVFISQLIEKQADIFLVACFAKKIPARIWRNMNLPCWNLHPSLLPKYRGPSPLHWQIRNDESETGLTLHEVSSPVDSGDIVARKSLPLPANHDNNSLDAWVSEQGVQLFYETLVEYLQGKLKPEPQDETIASYFPLPAEIIE